MHIIEVIANQSEVIRIMDFISPPMGLSFKLCASSHTDNLMKFSEDQNISLFRRHFPMGTNCAPLVADLFLYCYERDFMDSLNHDNQADVIEAFNSISRYLDDLFQRTI